MILLTCDNIVSLLDIDNHIDIETHNLFKWLKQQQQPRKSNTTNLNNTNPAGSNKIITSHKLNTLRLPGKSNNNLSPSCTTVINQQQTPTKTSNLNSIKSVENKNNFNPISTKSYTISKVIFYIVLIFLLPPQH